MLQPFPYDALWHYSEKFTRCPDLRQDLVLLTWKESLKDDKHSDIRLLKHYMKFRSKEIKDRNSLGKEVGGKSKKDVWRHDKVSINKRLMDGSAFTLADTLTSVTRDPLSACIANQFEQALSPDEFVVCDDMLAGYTSTEVKAKLGVDEMRYRKLKDAVREKTVEYLV